jgi:hypothetical protein
VPPGKRFVMTHVDAVNAGPANAQFEVLIGPIAAVLHQFQAIYASAHFVMKGVAYQGELVTLWIGADGVHVSVTGSLMSDNTDATGPPLVASGKPIRPPVPIGQPVAA